MPDFFGLVLMQEDVCVLLGGSTLACSCREVWWWWCLTKEVSQMQQLRNLFGDGDDV
jgi:hypothetical protein